jgi:hypothetical protein
MELLRRQRRRKWSEGWWGVLALAVLVIPLAPALDFFDTTPDDPGYSDGYPGDSVGLRPESGLVGSLVHIRHVTTTTVAFPLPRGITIHHAEVPDLTPPRAGQGFPARQTRTILWIYRAQDRSALTPSASATDPA